MARLYAACAGLRGHPLALPVAVLVGVLLVSHIAPAQLHGASVAVIAAGGLNLKVLRQREADINTEIRTLSDAIVAENRPMTDVERAKLADLKVKKTANRELLDIQEEINESDRHAPAAPDPDAAVAANSQHRVGVKDYVAEDPKKGFRSPTEFLMAVKTAAESPSRADARLQVLRVKATAGSDEQSGNEGQYGAFLVPTGFSPTLLQLTPEDDPTADQITMVPMSNPIVGIPARTDKDHTTSVSGGLVVSRKRETVAAASARMQTELVTLRANPLFGLSFATEEILVDSPISFAAILAASYQQEFAAHKFNERLNGKGGSEPLGVMNSPCLVSVAKETGQAAKTIVKENIDKMIAQCWKYGRAIWIANHDTYPSLASLAQVVGTGGMPVPYLTSDANGQFLLRSRPLFLSEFPATLGTKGDLILGVWSEYLEGLYQPMDSMESMHVRFAEHERAFKFWQRDDGGPWWKSALTPKQGANQLSPFVVLAAR